MNKIVALETSEADPLCPCQSSPVPVLEEDILFALMHTDNLAMDLQSPRALSAFS